MNALLSLISGSVIPRRQIAVARDKKADLVTSGNRMGKWSTWHLGRMRRSRSLGRWSGTVLKKDGMEVKKDSMLKVELNNTVSATKLRSKTTTRLLLFPIVSRVFCSMP